MAEAVVSLAMEWIRGCLIEKDSILKDVKGKVEDLLQELWDIWRYLKSADAKQYEDEQIRDWVAEVREAAYDAEDVISNFLLKGLRDERDLSKDFDQSYIESEIDAIKSKIARLIKSGKRCGLAASTERGCSSSAPERMTLDSDFEPDDFVGFKTDVETLLEKLVSKDKRCSVISICGMGGSGKTTLAQKLFQEEEVKGHFQARAWVCISQQWSQKDVLQTIFACLDPEQTKTIVNMNERLLVQRLSETMHKKKCLVVLDDIWSEEAWNDFLPAFRRAISSSSSKILLTSRKKDVAEYANKLGGYIHGLECLTEEEGLELLLRKAILPTADFKIDPSNKKLWMETVDPSKKELAMKMVEQCGRLPLAIVVLGGLLVGKDSLSEWQEVQRNVGSYLEGCKDNDQVDKKVSKVLELSYKELPYELKPCFLYLASFPEDFDIDAKKLYHLWIAEGFVSQRHNIHETTMEIAEQRLHKLAQRCMVQVKLEWEEKSVIKGRRRFKSLRLHDLMRDFCLLRAKEENFLTVINYGLKDEQVQHPFSVSSSTGASNSDSRKIHRVAIHFPSEDNVRNLQLLQQEGNLRSIRTLLFFYDDYIAESQFNTVYEDSRMLRVLDFITNKNRASEGLEIEVGNLLLLRYLGLKGGTGFKKLRSSIEKLRYLQTLDLRTKFRIIVPNVLWKMEGLVHLYLPHHENFSTDGSMLRVDGLNNLETIKNFAPDKVDVQGLFNLTKLRRLKRICIWVELELLKDVNNYLLNGDHPQLQETSFEFIGSCSQEDFNNLRQLLSCDCIVELCMCMSPLHNDCQSCEITCFTRLPEYNPQSYQRITSLTLLCAPLEEDPMATLEKLPNLRRLYLHSSFVGKEIVCSAHGFPNLKYLRLNYLNNLEEWRADNDAMPNLFTLWIKGCDKLKMLPDGLRSISTLRELRIKYMPDEFCDRLRMEGEDFHKVRHIPSIHLNQSRSSDELYPFKHRKWRIY